MKKIVQSVRKTDAVMLKSLCRELLDQALICAEEQSFVHHLGIGPAARQDYALALYRNNMLDGIRFDGPTALCDVNLRSDDLGKASCIVRIYYRLKNSNRALRLCLDITSS